MFVGTPVRSGHLQAIHLAAINEALPLPAHELVFQEALPGLGRRPPPTRNTGH